MRDGRHPDDLLTAVPGGQVVASSPGGGGVGSLPSLASPPLGECCLEVSQ